MLAMVSVAVPVLLSVTGWEALEVSTIICTGKVRLEVERETVYAAPVPLKLIVCVPVLALSVRVSVPALEPDAVGVKIMLIVQLPLAATVVPQVFDCE